jgi:hypothetical protein
MARKFWKIRMLICMHTYIHTYIHTHIYSSLSFNISVLKIRLSYTVMSCVSHCTVDILETYLDCNRFFFVEFNPLCYITLQITKCVSPPIFNNSLQAFTAGLTTVRFWHCVDSWVDRTFRRNVLRPLSGWRNYVHVDAELYLHAIPSHKDGGSASLRNVCVQIQ